MSSTRRSFLASSGVLLGAAALPVHATHAIGRRVAHDLVIRNGLVFDGLGGPGAVADIAIDGDRIARMAPRIADQGREEIDAGGLVVAPGFIDIHSHGDGNLDDDPRAESVIRQGITTIVVGADGSSRAHGTAEQGFATLFARWSAMNPAVNVASMVGLGTLRGAVVGNMDRPATTAETQRMRGMVESALREGACGVSSGLEYTPGAFASREELSAVCAPLARTGLSYTTHMRNEDDRLLDAIDESIAVAEGAGCALQISHLKTQGPRNWGRLDDVFRRIGAARSRGVDVAFDRYPYLAYSTGLTNLFPVWSRDGGIDAFLARLSDPVHAPRIERETRQKIELIGGWDNVQLSSVASVQDRDAEGKRLGSYSTAKGSDPYVQATQLIRNSRGEVGMAGFAMSEENLERILAHPLSMVCTDGGSFAVDGPTRRGSPHPRGIGSFPRVLARYVRERKTLSMAAALRKMSSLPASRVRLSDRGVLAPGKAADVVIFDAARVSDTSTFESPFQYPVGIHTVVVNGVMALREGTRHARGSGRGLAATIDR